MLRIWPLYFAVFFGLVLLAHLLRGVGPKAPYCWQEPFSSFSAYSASRPGTCRSIPSTWGASLMVSTFSRACLLSYLQDWPGVAVTRIQSPLEVWTWAAYNGVLLALIPYLAFRRRGYSHQALNLKSANFKNDCLVIVVVLLMSCALDLAGPNIFQLSSHQQIAGGLLSFFLNMAGTDLPVMIVIYSI
jgi:hypothetical protein